MKLYQAYFSFEICRETGDCVVVYPTLAEARSGSVALLKQEMQERVEGAEKYDGTLTEADNLSVVIAQVELPKMNVQTVCEIINSNGGRYVHCKKPIMTINLPAGTKRVHTQKGETVANTLRSTNAL